MWGNCWGGKAPDSGKGRGQGKGRTDKDPTGPGGRNRQPGTRPFLRNHRKMLAHMTSVAPQQLSLAVSDKDKALRNYKEDPTVESLAELRKATEWVSNRQLNVDWIALKRRSLDEQGVYIFNEENLIPLTQEEKEWNREMRLAEQAEQAGTCPARPAASAAERPSTAASSSEPAAGPAASARSSEPAAASSPPGATPQDHPAAPAASGGPATEPASSPAAAATVATQVGAAASAAPPPVEAKAMPARKTNQDGVPLPLGPLPAGPPPKTQTHCEGVHLTPSWEMSPNKRSASATGTAPVRERSSKARASSASRSPPPRHNREVPHFVMQAHEVRVGDEHDKDWTLSADWAEEKRLRDERNQLIKGQLLAGKTVAYRQSGWSLWPRVNSNDLCCYLPVRFDESVNEDDVVFCELQPRGQFYAHLVKEKQWDAYQGCYTYCISNMKGRVNGWCHLGHIYGKLFNVLY